MEVVDIVVPFIWSLCQSFSFYNIWVDMCGRRYIYCTYDIYIVHNYYVLFGYNDATYGKKHIHCGGERDHVTKAKSNEIYTCTDVK